MSRVKRVDVGGMIYHALNRANFRSRLFRRDAHDLEFPAVVGESRTIGSGSISRNPGRKWRGSEKPFKGAGRMARRSRWDGPWQPSAWKIPCAIPDGRQGQIAVPVTPFSLPGGFTCS